jgi:signal transduction histidine kinase
MGIPDPGMKKLHMETRRTALIQRLSILVFTVTLIYGALDWWLKFEGSLYFYGIMIGGSGITYLLSRSGRSQEAKFFGLMAFNIIIFIIASIQPRQTGMSLHLFGAGAAALTLFNYDEWPKAVFFACLSTVLFMMLNISQLNLFEPRTFTAKQSEIFFLLNVLVNALVCIYSVVLFSKLNFEAERELLRNETTIMKQNEELGKTNTELDRFVYSVSHDLRAPLSSIAGLIHLAENASDPKETREYLGLMKGRIDRLEQFIRDIINFSRNQRANNPGEVISLHDLIQQNYEALRNIEAAPQVRLENEVPPSLTMVGDKMRLDIVLSNLIANSMQYSNPRKDSVVKFTASTTADQITLVLEDNGIGISKQHLPRIFEMFYRATESSKGSGLGLYIVQEAINRLHGTIAVESVEREGTRFAITLPFVKARQTELTSVREQAEVPEG